MISIKGYRLKQTEACVAQHPDFVWYFIKGNITDKAMIDECFAKYQPDIVVNLAA